MLGAATTEEEGFALVQRCKPDLLICSSDLETGYGINLIKRVHAVSPSCQRLIVLVRETQAVVREAMDAYADGVMFKPSPKGRCITPRRFAAWARKCRGPIFPPWWRSSPGETLKWCRPWLSGSATKAWPINAQGRTQLVVKAIVYGLIDPQG
jgi:hypothetical protein